MDYALFYFYVWNIRVVLFLGLRIPVACVGIYVPSILDWFPLVLKKPIFFGGWSLKQLRGEATIVVGWFCALGLFFICGRTKILLGDW